MKIGLIVYSYTGHTRSVADQIAATLSAEGHDVAVEAVKARDENPNNRAAVELVSRPDPAPYDQLILGAPVNGFQLAQVMQTYLRSQPDFGGKPVRCFVTHHFPKAWLGGTQTNAQFRKLLTAAGATVVDTGVVNWSSKKRDQDIVELVARFSQI
jgi:flavodoxin